MSINQAKMNFAHQLATTIFEFTQVSSDFDVLTNLSKMAWSLKPLIEQKDSGVSPELGQELWMYIGVKRDANPEMAAKCAKRVAKLLQ